MAKLNYNEISENYKNIAPIECGMYLSSCLADEDKTRLRSDWESIGDVIQFPGGNGAMKILE